MEITIPIYGLGVVRLLYCMTVSFCFHILGQRDVALYLLENGANINAKTNGNQTPLHLAALGVNGSETLRLLLANKSLDRTIANNQGETAEGVAKRCGKWVELFKT